MKRKELAYYGGDLTPKDAKDRPFLSDFLTIRNAMMVSCKHIHVGSTKDEMLADKEIISHCHRPPIHHLIEQELEGATTCRSDFSLVCNLIALFFPLERNPFQSLGTKRERDEESEDDLFGDDDMADFGF